VSAISPNVLLLSVPATLNLPSLNSMSPSGRLQQVRRDLLALGDDLVQRLDDRGAADGERAGSVRPHAEQHAARVAVDDVDVLERNAELRRDHLRERRLVALAVAVRAGEHGDASGRMDAHLAGLEQTRARAECAGHRRRCDSARFDVRRVADARSLPRFAASALRAGNALTSAIFIASSSVWS
jgi:hypothetical protein